MKIFISADIEGIAGITHFDESDPTNAKGYSYFQDRMTDEVVAACEGALAAGAKEIWVKDAHWTGRNIHPHRLPKEVKLVRGWSRHPYMMVQEIDRSFDAVAFVGYHSRAGSSGNPLAHTLSGGTFSFIKVNGELFSEFRLYSGAAALEGVPAVFLAGDQALCQEVKAFDERILTVATMEGHGLSTISITPSLSCERICEGMRVALSRDFKGLLRPMGKSFEVEVGYLKHVSAYKNSFYPGAKLKSENIIEFKTDSYFEVLRLLTFVGTNA